MPPALLLLARHGETDWNSTGRAQGQTDVPLNARGREQASRLACRLAGAGLEAIVSSDLSRAAETARIVGEAAGLEPVFDPRFRELRLGELEGRPGAEWKARFSSLLAEVARSRDPVAPGAETFQEFRARLTAGWADLAKRHAGRRLLLVAHGGALKALLCILLELPDACVDRLSLRGNTGLSVVEFREEKARLALLNCTRHLEEREVAGPGTLQA